MRSQERKLNRLKGFDYSQNGWYFVTICIKFHQKWFGDVVSEEMVLNEYGKIILTCWMDLPNHYGNCSIDEFIIMPNHIHGIIIIKNPKNTVVVGTIHELSLQNNKLDWKQRRIMVLPKIVGFFKMNSSKLIHQKGNNSFRWQRSFYDHIFRKKQSLITIRQYIRDNPKNWKKDETELLTDFSENFL